MPNPYKKHIIKHWGIQHEGPFGIKKLCAGKLDGFRPPLLT